MTRRPNHVPALQLQLLEEFTSSGVPVTLVVCEGSLTGEDGARLRDQLLVQLRHGPRHLLLDLAEVTGFDDTAAAILIDAHRRAPAGGCSFGLVAPAQDVVSRLRLTGLHRFLVWHATLEQALSALQPPIDELQATLSTRSIRNDVARRHRSGDVPSRGQARRRPAWCCWAAVPRG